MPLQENLGYSQHMMVWREPWEECSGGKIDGQVRSCHPGQMPGLLASAGMGQGRMCRAGKHLHGINMGRQCVYHSWSNSAWWLPVNFCAVSRGMDGRSAGQGSSEWEGLCNGAMAMAWAVLLLCLK